MIKDLFKRRKHKSDKKKLMQFTKMAVTIILVAAIVWITWSYVLATISVVMYGNSQPLESLSKQVCVTLLGTSLGYFVKAFFESYAEKKAQLDELKIKTEILEDESSDAVG